jgi:hypothetical protein
LTNAFLDDLTQDGFPSGASSIFGSVRSRDRVMSAREGVDQIIKAAGGT